MHTQNLRVHNLPAQVAEDELAGSTVVVIDLLRATSTICAALAAGALEVVPYLEVNETLAAAAAAGRSTVVLGGERGGRLIEGFDLGNSPSEYTPATVGGRRVLLTTTNGTRALWHARQAARVIVAAFVNLSAVARSLQDAPHVDILCAGTDGRESREDILAAGALVEQLLLTEHGEIWEPDAQARAALAAWKSRGPDLAIELRSTPGGENLLAIGHNADLVDCARIDTLAVVPELDIPAWRITAQ